MADDDLWWGEPNRSRRWHVFEGDAMAESLCGNWMFNRRNEEAIDPDDEEYRDGKDCKECCRKAGILEDD